MYGFVEVATKMVEYGVIDLSETVEVLFVVFSKFIPSWLIFLDGQVKYIRYIWDYLEDEAFYFRRVLNLNCTCNITPFSE